MTSSPDSYLKAVRCALKSALSLDFSSEIDRKSYVKNQINRDPDEKVFITSNINGIRISIAIKRNYISEIVSSEFSKFKTRVNNKCTIKEREPEPGYAIYFLITNIVQTRKQEIEDYVVNLIEDIENYSVSEKPPISACVKLNTYCEVTKNIIYYKLYNLYVHVENYMMMAKRIFSRLLIELILMFLFCLYIMDTAGIC